MPKPKVLPAISKDPDSVLTVQKIASKFKLPPTGGIKRPPEIRPDSEILTEIRECQKQTTPFFDSTEFRNVTEEILGDIAGSDYTIGKKALCALRAASEEHLTALMQTSNQIATEKGRMTILPSDLQEAIVKDQFQRDLRKIELDERRLKYHRAYLIDHFGVEMP